MIVVRVYKCFHQERAIAPSVLPALTHPPGNLSQNVTGKFFELNPWKNQNPVLLITQGRFLDAVAVSMLSTGLELSGR